VLIRSAGHKKEEHKLIFVCDSNPSPFVESVLMQFESGMIDWKLLIKKDKRRERQMSEWRGFLRSSLGLGSTLGSCLIRSLLGTRLELLCYNFSQE
jgi:hypothetical protein